MSDDPVLGRVADYYSEKLATHGTTSAGVDWNSTESQELRFDQLLHGVDRTRPLSVLDYGCGYGAMGEWLAERVQLERYVGFDVAEPMVQAARERHADRAGWEFTSDEAQLQPVDLVVASGIFNVRLETPAAEWEAHVLATIDRMAELATWGFSFNCLTSYSDEDRKQDYLFYGDPGRLFDHCRRNHSRHVALLHDYGLWEFTIAVRRDA